MVFLKALQEVSQVFQEFLKGSRGILWDFSRVLCDLRGLRGFLGRPMSVVEFWSVPGVFKWFQGCSMGFLGCSMTFRSATKGFTSVQGFQECTRVFQRRSSDFKGVSMVFQGITG